LCAPPYKTPSHGQPHPVVGRYYWDAASTTISMKGDTVTQNFATGKRYEAKLAGHRFRWSVTRQVQ
jgi:hypothetical protein